MKKSKKKSDVRSVGESNGRGGVDFKIVPAPPGAFDRAMRSVTTTRLPYGGFRCKVKIVEREPSPPLPPFMSTDSAVRKRMPVATGCMAYFPDALMCVAFVSKVGNDKHNPGQPLHWAKEKSTDEPDCEARHMLDYLRGVAPDPGLEPLGELGHLASKAWRALAHLQRACDAERARRAGK